MEPQKSNYVLIGGIITLIIAIAFFGLFQYTKKESGTVTVTPEAVPPTPEPIATTTQIETIKLLYKDGVYSSDGEYLTPGGSEKVAVKITLKNDVIVDAQVEAEAIRPTAVRYQDIFIKNYKQLVVGKKISELQLNKVSGSSLTPKGFNDALAKIKVQAKV